MSKRILVAAAAALLFIGAGCVGRPAVQPPAGGQTPTSAAPANTVDQAVNDIVGDEQTGADATDQEAGDTSELNAANSETNAFGESDYGVQ